MAGWLPIDENSFSLSPVKLNRGERELDQPSSFTIQDD
jgi:hypothetical protein